MTARGARSLVLLLAQAVGWGALGAVAATPAGLAALAVGSRLYPQPYEQIPSAFFFFPLGLFVGFVAVGMSRLALRDWRWPTMIVFVVLTAVGYAGAVFEYCRRHALRESIAAAMEPGDIQAAVCSPSACETADPPLQWHVAGELRLREATGLGARIDRIEISSDTMRPGRVAPHRYTQEEGAEAARWRGPTITLSGRDIPGPRDLTPYGEAVYPIRYGYHTRDGTPRRSIWVTVFVTDRVGRAASTQAAWRSE